MALIFVVSSVEQSPLPMPEFEWLTIDKLYHFIEYAILGWTTRHSLCKGETRGNTIKTYMAARQRYSQFSTVQAMNGIRHSSGVGSLRLQIGWQMCLGSIAGVLAVYLYYKKKVF